MKNLKIVWEEADGHIADNVGVHYPDMTFKEALNAAYCLVGVMEHHFPSFRETIIEALLELDPKEHGVVTDHKKPEQESV